jgi:hypothetical protein
MRVNQPAVPGKSPATGKTAVAKRTGDNKSPPAYLLMGRKRVEFIGSARALSLVLSETYGSEMSISKFERALVELRAKKALKDKVFLTDALLQLHSAYVCAKSAMVDEQNLLRSTFSTVHVESSVDVLSVEELFAPSESVSTALIGAVKSAVKSAEKPFLEPWFEEVEAEKAGADVSHASTG